MFHGCAALSWPRQDTSLEAYRPTPDWRDFKREVLRWDFYKDVFDEQVALEKEVEKLLPEMEETMEEKEIEEYLSKQRLKDLTEARSNGTLSLLSRYRD